MLILDRQLRIVHAQAVYENPEAFDSPEFWENHWHPIVQNYEYNEEEIARCLRKMEAYDAARAGADPGL
jgi:hypothetical protein